MIKTLIFTACVFLTINVSAQQRSKKVVFIIADGISADALERENLPNFKKIIAAGPYSRMHVGRDKGSYNGNANYLCGGVQ